MKTARKRSPRAASKPSAKAVLTGKAPGPRRAVAVKSPSVGKPRPQTIAPIRAKADLSRSKFARLTGFSERALANWETGKQAPDAATQRRLHEIDRLFDALAGVMTHGAIAPWLDTPNPAFDNLKPLEVIERGQLDRLWRMIFELESGSAS